MTMLPVVVLAGGVGSRIASVDPTVPKPMLPVHGRPFLDWKLAGLVAQGVTEVLVLVSHRSDVIKNHLASEPVAGLSVTIIDEGPEPLGTAGALRAAIDSLPDRFFVTYGDSYLTESFDALGRLFDERRPEGAIAVVEFDTELQPGNTALDGDVVVEYHKSKVPGRFPYLDYGQLALERNALLRLPEGFRGDLAGLLEPLIADRALLAVVVDALFFDLNTPEALEATAASFTDLGLPDLLDRYFS